MNIFLELFNVFDYINKKTYVTLYVTGQCLFNVPDVTLFP